MSLPESSQLWTYAKNLEIKSLGGNMMGLRNYCAVRVSYALRMKGHSIKIDSDYKDKDGNKYIIKTKTMQSYLNDYYKQGKVVASINGLSGIVFFKDCNYQTAAGHFDIVVDGEVAGMDQSHRAKQIIFWQC